MALNPKQMKCLEMMMEHPKMKMGDIAKELNVTAKTISVWKKSPEFSDEYTSLFKNRLLYIAKKALDKQEQLLDTPNEMVAYLAAKDLMDRAGFQATEKVEQTVDMDLNITVDYGDDE